LYPNFLFFLILEIKNSRFIWWNCDFDWVKLNFGFVIYRLSNELICDLLQVSTWKAVHEPVLLVTLVWVKVNFVTMHFYVCFFKFIQTRFQITITIKTLKTFILLVLTLDWCFVLDLRHCFIKNFKWRKSLPIKIATLVSRKSRPIVEKSTGTFLLILIIKLL
jgi:hypothetical protein